MGFMRIEKDFVGNLPSKVRFNLEEVLYKCSAENEKVKKQIGDLGLCQNRTGGLGSQLNEYGHEYLHDHWHEYKV